MKRMILAVSLAVLAAAGEASAAPYVTVDGSSAVIVMLDQGSLHRRGGTVDGDALLVPKAGNPVIAAFRFDCPALTWQQVGSRTVGNDLTVSPSIPVAGPASVVEKGSIGEALLMKACFNRQVNSTGGWGRPTLQAAVAAARAVFARNDGQ